MGSAVHVHMPWIPMRIECRPLALRTCGRTRQIPEGTRPRGVSLMLACRACQGVLGPGCGLNGSGGPGQAG